MKKKNHYSLGQAVVPVAITVSPYSSSAAEKPSAPVAPATMARIGTIDERFQSFNVEMIEVTGGRFWKSYRDNEAKAAAPSSAKAAGAVPAGMDPVLVQIPATGRSRKSKQPIEIIGVDAVSASEKHDTLLMTVRVASKLGKGVADDHRARVG